MNNNITNTRFTRYHLSEVVLLITLLICLPFSLFINATDSEKWQNKQNILNSLIETQRSIVKELNDANLYDISLNLSADCLSIDGKQKIYYTNTENVPLDNIYFS